MKKTVELILSLLFLFAVTGTELVLTAAELRGIAIESQYSSNPLTVKK